MNEILTRDHPYFRTTSLLVIGWPRGVQLKIFSFFVFTLKKTLFRITSNRTCKAITDPSTVTPLPVNDLSTASYSSLSYIYVPAFCTAQALTHSTSLHQYTSHKMLTAQAYSDILCSCSFLEQPQSLHLQPQT